MADVLLINTDTSAIGTRNSSNLALLETIFRENRKIVGKSTPTKKKLVFALRDFRFEHHKLPNIQ